MNSHRLRDFSPPEGGHLVAVDVEGTAVAVTVTDGELHAFDDTCTHAGAAHEGAPGSASAGTDLDIAAIIEREHAALAISSMRSRG